MDKPIFEQIVDAYYEMLYRFALSLSRSEAEAGDLTQETFYVYATKGHQLRDKSKAKSWLFTTLHREFLGRRRKSGRHPHQDLESAAVELPVVEPRLVERLDSARIVEMLGEVDEVYRTPLILFYLKQHSYLEIAGILHVPMGTVMSRLARGKLQLKKMMAEPTADADNIVPIQSGSAHERMRHEK